MVGGLELSFDVCSRRTIGEFSLKCKNKIFGTFRVRLLKEGTDDDVEAVAFVLEASLGVSVTGGVLKFGWLGSQFFRSHRDTDRHAAEAEKITPAGPCQQFASVVRAG
jgi:hypothetical protein